MKKYLLFLLAACMILCATACAAPAAPAAPTAAPAAPAAPEATAQQPAPATAVDTTVIQIGHSVTEKSAWHEGLLRFAELVDTYSNGSVKIEIFPNGTLGSEREMIEGMGLASVQGGLVSTSIASGFTDSMLIMDMPFLFKDTKHAQAFMKSDLGKQVLATTEKIGIHGLGWFQNGFRQTCSIKPVSSLADMKAKKVRCVESTLYLDMMDAFGANPVSMTWGDVYTALQQGTIDGMESTNDNTYKAGMHKIAQNILCTNQIFSGVILGINTEVWNGLSVDQQAALTKAAEEACPYQWERSDKYEMEARDAMRADGANVLNEDEIADIDAWRATVEPIYTKWAERAGGMELINSIRNMQY